LSISYFKTRGSKVTGGCLELKYTKYTATAGTPQLWTVHPAGAAETYGNLNVGNYSSTAGSRLCALFAATTKRKRKKDALEVNSTQFVFYTVCSARYSDSRE